MNSGTGPTPDKKSIYQLESSTLGVQSDPVAPESQAEAERSGGQSKEIPVEDAEVDSALDAALEYAERFGLAVFPCKPRGKAPLTEHGHNDATRDPDQIREWWKRWPDANLGIATGAISGFAVLDIDIDERRHGDETLAKLEAHYGKLPATPTVLTGGGGVHFYLRAPGMRVPNSSDKIGEGIDVRGDGGYVIAPPSMHRSGEPYRWKASVRIDEVALSPMPEWLLGFAVQSGSSANENGGNEAPTGFDLLRALGGVPHGQRDDQIFRAACSFRATNTVEKVAMQACLDAAEKCEPSFPAELVREKVARAYRTYPAGHTPAFNAQTEEQRIIAELAALDPIARGQRRREAAKQLGVTVQAVDQAVKRAHNAARKRFEHSNGDRLSSTGTGTSDDSNECSSGDLNAADSNALYEVAKEIIEHPDPLALVERAIMASGYAGDPTPSALAYIAVSSRLLDRPLNIQFLAQSASGKNFTVDTALRLFPPEAYYKITASSPRALIYTSEEFRHRTVVLEECDSVPAEGPAASAIRSLVNDSSMSYETVEKDPETGKFQSRPITKEGPTGMITTGVRALDAQMATRTLSCPITDSPAQTREILRAQAKAAAQGRISTLPQAEIRKFHAYQRWLAANNSRIVIPFAPILGEIFTAEPVRARRDFPQLLTVISTLALMAQSNRPRAEDGAIVAALDDYRQARRIMAPLFDSAAADGITPVVRDTVESVKEGQEVSEAGLAIRLKLAKSTIHYRVGRALGGGWLKNLEIRKGYPARLVRGDPLPEARSALPTVDELKRAFESLSGHSNSDSNTPEVIGRERDSADAFERSSDFQLVDECDGEAGLELYPDDDATVGEERDDPSRK